MAAENEVPTPRETFYWPVTLPSERRPAGAMLRLERPETDHYRKRYAIRGWFGSPAPGGDHERLALVVWVPMPGREFDPQTHPSTIDFAADVTFQELLGARQALLDWVTTERAKRALRERAL